jgi:hypothetical protein
MVRFTGARRLAICAGVAFTAVCAQASAQSTQPSPISGSVPATLSLTLGPPVAFGTFTPGVTRDYFASTTANVTSTAANAALIVVDSSSFYTNHLVNGSFALPQEVQIKNNFGNYQTMPAGIRFWGAPTTNEVVPIDMKQSIASTDGLRSGAYNKPLTFTLSTTQP